MIASAAASSWTMPPKSMANAVAPVRGPGPSSVSHCKAAAAPRLKLLSTRWQQLGGEDVALPQSGGDRHRGLPADLPVIRAGDRPLSSLGRRHRQPAEPG